MTRGKHLFVLSVSLVACFGCKRGDGASKAWLELCTGFAVSGSTSGLLVARAHAGSPPLAPLPGAPQHKRVEETLDSLDANPLADAALSITVGAQTFSDVRSNSRGYIDLDRLPGFSPPVVRVHMQLADSRYEAAPLDEDIPVYDASPGLAVISDIDDTLLDSEVVHKAKMVENALTRSTWELIAFPGAAETLSKLAAGLPIFYVSGSPWAFRQRIGSYFQRVGIPKGSLLLKRFSSDPLLDQMTFKWQHISRVLEALPQKRWLLFGDSGEKDPEIYRRFLNEHGDRVAAIYIHLVTPEEPSAPRFAGMRTFKSWAELNQPAPTAQPPTATPTPAANH